MADQFMTILGTTLTDAGYTVVLQSSPAVKEWNVPQLPFVSIAPANKDRPKYHAFGVKVNMPNAYQFFLIQKNNMVNVPNDMANQFTVDVTSAFMPTPTSLRNAGAWQTRLNSLHDIDRTVFPADWIVTSAELEIQWILGG